MLSDRYLNCGLAAPAGAYEKKARSGRERSLLAEPLFGGFLRLPIARQEALQASP